MACPLCGGPDGTVIANELRYGPGLVFHCPTCDLGYLAEQAAEDLAAYYANDYRKQHGHVLGQVPRPQDVFAAHINDQRGRLALLRPHLTPNTRLLEVGCSAGQFLNAVQPLVAEVVGVDYNPEFAAFAAATLGCQTYGQGLDAADLAPESFDVVCAFQTLEHVPDPVPFMEKLVRHLKPGGTIMIEVPNLHDPLLSVFDVPCYRRFFYHRAHALYFTRASLLTVMRRAGLGGQVHFHQDYNFTNHLHWVHRDAPQPFGALGLGPARLPGLRADLGADARAELDAWAEEADQRYKAVLARHGLTDNMTFLGHKQ